MCENNIKLFLQECIILSIWKYDGFKFVAILYEFDINVSINNNTESQAKRKMHIFLIICLLL